MNILITGATGFIGSNLLEELNNFPGINLRASVRRSKLLCCETVEVGDLAQKIDWSRALEGIDVVVHLAGSAHKMNTSYYDVLSEYRKVNSEATLNLANKAVKNGVKRFIYLSSIKVNGEQTFVEPFTPDKYNLPNDPYGLSKYEAEQGLLNVSKETGMEVVIIRPTLVYGPGVKGNFQSMMKWVYLGLPVPLGSVNNKRSFVSTFNLIDFIRVCIFHQKAANQIFLVSDDEDLSTSDLFRKLGSAFSKKTRLVPFPTSIIEKALCVVGKNGIAQRLFYNLQVDITKNKDILSWTPPFGVDSSLKLTANSWLENYK